MKNIGIWIDKREAKLISLSGDVEELQVIKSNLEEYNVKGGSGTRMKGGPQEVVQDSRYKEREKHQLRAFFSDIVEQLGEVDSVVIFGPAQVPNKLHKELSETYPQLLEKVRGVEKADSMTDNQTKAWVRDYFAE